MQHDTHAHTIVSVTSTGTVDRARHRLHQNKKLRPRVVYADGGMLEQHVAKLRIFTPGKHRQSCAVQRAARGRLQVKKIPPVRMRAITNSKTTWNFHFSRVLYARAITRRRAPEKQDNHVLFVWVRRRVIARIQYPIKQQLSKKLDTDVWPSTPSNSMFSKPTPRLHGNSIFLPAHKECRASANRCSTPYLSCDRGADHPDVQTTLEGREHRLRHPRRFARDRQDCKRREAS